MNEAEVKEFTNRLLTCPICYGVFDDPVTLQCGHTYCRTCLTSCIKNNRGAIRDELIPCSVHCAGTKVPDPQKPADTWPSQLSPSFVIVDILNEFKQKVGSECSKCKSSQKTSAAVKWCRMCVHCLCEGCISHHRKDPTTRLHTLTDLPSASEKHTQQYPRCEDHRDELVMLICEDCNQAICNTCCNLQHMQCRLVVHMETKLERIQANMFDEKSKLDAKITRKKVSVADYKSKVDEIRKTKTVASSNIREQFQKLSDSIKEKESFLLHQLEDVTERNVEKLQDRIKTEENNLQLLQQHAHFLKKAVRAGSVVDMYKMSQIKLPSDITMDNPQSVLKEIAQVEFSDNVHQILDKVDKLNLIASSSSSSPELVAIVEWIFPDEESPVISDVTVLDVAGTQTTVVTDYTNRCVKSVCTQYNKTQHSRLVLSGNPLSLTQLNKNQVMVAVARQIATVSVTPDLVLESTIRTSKTYWSLAVLGPTSLAAGGENCVDILNMNGNVMKSVTTHNNVKLFDCPFYMCLSRDHLIVSDCGQNAVTCLTLDMGFVWRYSSSDKGQLSHPLGITTTSGGDILVADSQMNKVILLTESGQFVRDVLTFRECLNYPMGIYVDKHNALHVCDDDDKVKCFTN